MSAGYREHEQVLLGRPTPIDRDIAELIELCWKLGWDTNYSCQGDPLPTGSYEDSCGYISFVHFEDCRTFSRVVRPPGSPIKLDKGRPTRQLGSCFYFAWRVIPQMVAALRQYAAER